MSLYQDRQIKGFLLFLTLFALLFVGTATVLTIYQVNDAEVLWLKHDEAVSSSLLEQGVPKEVVAVAFTNTDISDDGRSLLAAAVIGLYFIFFRFCELSMLFLASRQQRRFAQNTLQQPDGACPVPPAISAVHALSRKQKLLCYFGLLFCWLFWFLYQFPGVLTPDSIMRIYPQH